MSNDFHPRGFALGGIWESGCFCGWSCQASTAGLAYDLLRKHQRSCSGIVSRSA